MRPQKKNTSRLDTCSSVRTFYPRDHGRWPVHMAVNEWMYEMDAILFYYIHVFVFIYYYLFCILSSAGQKVSFLKEWARLIPYPASTWRVPLWRRWPRCCRRMWWWRGRSPGSPPPCCTVPPPRYPCQSECACKRDLTCRPCMVAHNLI